MKILALESTAKVASVAVTDDENVLAAETSDGCFTQSEVLLPAVERLLAAAHLSISDIELFAVTRGPGSFTGVRIGVATVKGLAFGRDVPCVGISTLSSLAENLHGFKGLIVPVMDARRGEVYTALFRGDKDGITRLTEDTAIGFSDLFALIEKQDIRPIYFVGDGYQPVMDAFSDSGLPIENTPEALRPENAVSTARVALLEYRKGNATTDVLLSPSYLRLPQAERERLERLKSNS